jgi:hypothetical protein
VTDDPVSRARATISSSYKEASSSLATSSEKFSSAARPLALSAIAIVWLLASGPSAPIKQSLSNVLSEPWLGSSVALAVLALALDVVQYLISTVSLLVYRWALWEVIANDSRAVEGPQAARSWTEGIAWTILRMNGVRGRLGALFDEDIPWKRLRDKMTPPLSIKEASSELPVTPRMVAGAVALAFLGKAGCLLSAYACLTWFVVTRQ